ncbi:hypothetical protein TWF694_011888 [Orbilia ellipsospora]|uniref:Uncharacterized protein n=1 Tax=Orbilia ellipsospora TaxID=2528407 RepID=A0AAV9X7S3_9PEZI
MMNQPMTSSRPAGPVSFSPAPGAPPPASGGPVPNSNLAAQQQQQLLIQKAQENQNQLQLDKSRVSLLLEINAELLKESLGLQATKAAATQDNSDDLKSLEKSYNECMHRLKVNLAYLAAMADRRTASLPASPALLIPPSTVPSLIEPYKKLQALFPGMNSSTGAISNPQSGHNRAISQSMMANPALKPSAPSQQSQVAHNSPSQQPQQQPQQSQPSQQMAAAQHALSQPPAHPQQSALQPVSIAQNQAGSIAPTMMQNVMQNHIHPGPIQNLNHLSQMNQMSPHQQQQLQQIQQIQQQQALNRQQQQQNAQMTMHPQQAGQMNMNAMNFNPGFYLQQAQMQAQMMRPQQNPRMMAVANTAGMGSTGMMAPTINPQMPGMDPMFGTGEMNWNFGMPGNWGVGGTS